MFMALCALFVWVAFIFFLHVLLCKLVHMSFHVHVYIVHVHVCIVVCPLPEGFVVFFFLV